MASRRERLARIRQNRLVAQATAPAPEPVALPVPVVVVQDDVPSWPCLPLRSVPDEQNPRFAPYGRGGWA